MSFESGGVAVLLPTKVYKKDDLNPINYGSILLMALRKASCATDIQRLEMRVDGAAAGHRLICAILLKKEPLAEQEIIEIFALLEAAPAPAHVFQLPRKSKGGAS